MAGQGSVADGFLGFFGLFFLLLPLVFYSSFFFSSFVSLSVMRLLVVFFSNLLCISLVALFTGLCTSLVYAINGSQA